MVLWCSAVQSRSHSDQPRHQSQSLSGRLARLRDTRASVHRANRANRAAWPVAAFAALAAAVFAELSKLGSGPPALPGPPVSPSLSLARMRIHNVCDRFRGSGIFRAKSHPDS
jgi:hypothetical protein